MKVSNIDSNCEIPIMYRNSLKKKFKLVTNNILVVIPQLKVVLEIQMEE